MLRLRVLLSCLILSFVGSAVAETSSQVVEVPDENLKQLLLERKNKYGHQGNELTLSDLRKIYVLHANNRGITDLTGLEHCIHLSELRVSKNAISDLSPLSKCKNLQSLDVSHNRVTVLSPLSGNTKLQYLNVVHNRLTHLRGVESLLALNSLYASHNRIQSLDPVSNLKKLWSLDVSSNQVVDASPAHSLARLTSLNVSNNPLKGKTAIARTRVSEEAYSIGRFLEETDLGWLQVPKQAKEVLSSFNQVLGRMMEAAMFGADDASKRQEAKSITSE